MERWYNITHQGVRKDEQSKRNKHYYIKGRQTHLAYCLRLYYVYVMCKCVCVCGCRLPPRCPVTCVIEDSAVKLLNDTMTELSAK